LAQFLLWTTHAAKRIMVGVKIHSASATGEETTKLNLKIRDLADQQPNRVRPSQPRRPAASFGAVYTLHRRKKDKQRPC
jgi:hypothetical protein